MPCPVLVWILCQQTPLLPSAMRCELLLSPVASAGRACVRACVRACACMMLAAFLSKPMFAHRAKLFAAFFLFSCVAQPGTIFCAWSIPFIHFLCLFAAAYTFRGSNLVGVYPLPPLLAISMRPVIQIDIVSDTVCPWCFIAKRRLEQVCAVAE